MLIAVFAVERTLLLDEAHVDERLAARVGGADEVVGAPGLTQGGHEGPPGDAEGGLRGGALPSIELFVFVCLFHRFFGLNFNFFVVFMSSLFISISFSFFSNYYYTWQVHLT